VVVRFAGPRPDAQLVVKVGWSPAGAAALAAQRDALAALRRSAGLGALDAVLPRTVASGEAGGRPWVVERALPGADGRRWTRGGGPRRGAGGPGRAGALAPPRPAGERRGARGGGHRPARAGRVPGARAAAPARRRRAAVGARGAPAGALRARRRPEHARARRA